jgi:hypothetical protein
MLIHAFGDPLIAVLPSASSILGHIQSSDVGKLVEESSGRAILPSSTSTGIHKFLGMVACVPTATTAGSTIPFYIQPIRGQVVELTYSTDGSTTLPATTDIGDYVGFSTKTGVSEIGMDTKSSSPGIAFLKIAGFENARRKIFGVVNSTNLAL